MALQKIALSGDVVKHSGVVTGAVATVATDSYAETKLIVIDTSVGSCDGNGGAVHSGGSFTVMPTTTKSYAEGQKIVRDGDTLTCGAVITASATESYAG